VVVIGESSNNLGAGWGLQGLNRLVSTSHGKLWDIGSGVPELFRGTPSPLGATLRARRRTSAR
jgi:hypothetical protein